jgi:hypothetical protein
MTARGYRGRRSLERAAPAAFFVRMNPMITVGIRQPKMMLMSSIPGVHLILP